jgi:hypothetical protein
VKYTQQLTGNASKMQGFFLALGDLIAIRPAIPYSCVNHSAGKSPAFVDGVSPELPRAAPQREDYVAFHSVPSRKIVGSRRFRLGCIEL